MFSLKLAILIFSLPHKDFFHDLGEMLVKFKSVWRRRLRMSSGLHGLLSHIMQWRFFVVMVVLFLVLHVCARP